MFRGKVRRIHFVGIGGTGMSGIAEVLLSMGFTVSGSDLKPGAAARRLSELGAHVLAGHAPEHVQGVDVVVRSTAIPAHNVELLAAQANKIPVIPRAEMLGELMRMKVGIAVAGTHGKTTTTSMVARCLQVAGLDPTVVIGGRLDSLGSSARLGAGDLMVAEADESDGSFLLLDPTITVVTNIDPEHLDHWGTEQALIDGFAEFAGKVPFFGCAAMCVDHPTVKALLPRIGRPVTTYGLGAEAEVRGTELVARGMSTTFQVHLGGAHQGAITLGMPGRHNVLNALAAVTVCLELGVPFATIAEGLHHFSGVDRRFSVRAEGSLPGAADPSPVTIIDDYGHHPTEIAATLRAAREAWPERRILAVFQPHRFTRVRDLLDDFARCFGPADQVVVCPVYPAGERPIEGIDQRSLGHRIREAGQAAVQPVDSLEEATAWLLAALVPGDVVLTLGAGDVNAVCSDLAQAAAIEGGHRGH